MTILLWQKPLTQVVRQIVQRYNGAWFDPSDMSTLYQDAAGTTPVTAVEQPVGKILDKSSNGNHATQSVTASRPTLSARYNLLTKTEDFSDAVWSKIGTGGVTVLSNVATAPDGTTTADKLIANSVAGTHYIQQGVAYTASAQHRFMIYVKAAEVSSLRLFLFSTAYGTTFNASTGEFSGTTVGLGTYAAQLVDGWWLVSLTATASASPVNRLEIYTSNNNAGDGVSGIYIWGADLRLGTTPGPYQRVNTATDYDTDERYFPKYLRFDGIDDYLTLGDVFDIGINGVSINTSVILFGSTKSPIAGKSRAAATGGRYFLGAEPNSFLLASHDSALPVNIAYSQSIGESVVLSAKLGPHGNRSLSLYKNENLLSTVNTSLTTASYDTTDPFWIGAYPNSTGTTPAYGYLKGGIYGLIVTQSALTDAQRIACERHLSRKAGVLL